MTDWRSFVRSRIILTKPGGAPTFMGTITPLPQKRGSSLRTFQRSASDRPLSRAVDNSASGTPARRSSGVQINAPLCPIVSSVVQPRRCLCAGAPGGHLILGVKADDGVVGSAPHDGFKEGQLKASRRG